MSIYHSLKLKNINKYNTISFLTDINDSLHFYIMWKQLVASVFADLIMWTFIGVVAAVTESGAERHTRGYRDLTSRANKQNAAPSCEFAHTKISFVSLYIIILSFYSHCLLTAASGGKYVCRCVFFLIWFLILSNRNGGYWIIWC